MAARKNVNFRMQAEDDTARGFRSVTQRFRRLGATIARNAARLTAGALVAGLAAAGVAAAKLLELFDNISKTARELDVSPTFVRQLEQVSALLGVRQDAFAKGLTRLREDSTETVKALQELGINVEAFRQLEGADQITTVINLLEGLESQSEKTARAVDIFGARLGRQFVLLANTGSATIERELKTALESGADVAETLGERSERLRDIMTRAFQDIENSSASALDSFLAWTDSILDSVLFADKFGRTALDAIDKTTAGYKRLNNLQVATNDLANKSILAFREVTKESAGRAAKLADEIDDLFAVLNARQEEAVNATRQKVDSLIAAIRTLRAQNRSGLEGQDARFGAVRATREQTAISDLKAFQQRREQTKALTTIQKTLQAGQVGRFG